MNLANPKMMDVVVPANPKIGLLQGGLEARGWLLNIVEGKAALGDDDMSLIDFARPGANGSAMGRLLRLVMRPISTSPEI